MAVPVLRPASTRKPADVAPFQQPCCENFGAVDLVNGKTPDEGSGADSCRFEPPEGNSLAGWGDGDTTRSGQVGSKGSRWVML